MAMVRMEPVEVRVKTGWLDGAPREITWGEPKVGEMSTVYFILFVA